MSAEIISIGEELLSGDSDIVDTNSIFINKKLREIGLRVLYKSTVGDDEQRITDVIKLALSRVDVIITTGGLGPTVDDMTRQGIANAVGQPLEFRQTLLDEIAVKFSKFGSRMSDNNRSQATIPQGAISIDNPVGTAPGFIVEYDGHAILSVPGVPREMKVLMEETVIPYLQEKFGAKGIIKTRVLRTAGIGESLIDEMIGEFEKLKNPVVGLAAHSGQTDIRIYARAATEAEADVLIAEVETEIRHRMGSYIFGVEKEPLEVAFVNALQQSGQRVTLIETGTSGLLHQQIKSAPGGAAVIASAELYDSVDQLVGTATDSSKFQELAEQTAQKTWEKLHTGIVIVIFSEERGTAIGLRTGDETRSRTYGYGSNTSGGSDWANGWALAMSWHMLVSQAAQTTKDQP